MVQLYSDLDCGIRGHFDCHKFLPYVIHQTPLSCGYIGFKNCPYIDAHPHIFLIFLLRGFFEPHNAYRHKQIVHEGAVEITYADLQTFGFLGSDGFVSKFGHLLYNMAEKFEWTPQEFLRVLRNKSVLLSLSNKQLKRYLADQYPEYVED